MLTIHRDPALIKLKAQADLDAAKVRASAELVAMIGAALNQFTAGYPVQETLAWASKLTAARAVLAFAYDPIIDLEAKALGITPVELAAKVVAKGEAWQAILARAAALRSTMQAAISKATSADDLPGLLAEARAAIAGLVA